MSYSAVNLQEKLNLVHERWTPKIVAQMNDYHIKLVKVAGEFVWHSHADTDELFLVLAGRLTIDLADGQVELGPGELFVVPRGVEHRPRAVGECQLLLVEPAGLVNTGDTGGAMTAPADAWI